MGVSSTYPASNTEDMAVMFAALLVLRHVGKKVHMIAILASTEDIGDLMIANYFLKAENNLYSWHHWNWTLILVASYKEPVLSAGFRDFAITDINQFQSPDPIHRHLASNP